MSRTDGTSVIEKSALFCLARGFVYEKWKWNRSEIILSIQGRRGDSLLIWLLSKPSPPSLEAINRSRQFCNDPGVHEMVDSVPSRSNFNPIRVKIDARVVPPRQLGRCIPIRFVSRNRRGKRHWENLTLSRWPRKIKGRGGVEKTREA